MPFWLVLAVLAQLVHACVAIFDKYVVTSKEVLRPLSYAYYISVMSSLTLLVFFFGWVPLPFENLAVPSFLNLEIPDGRVIVLSLLSGLAMFQALFYLFKSLSKADASDVMPVVGAISAITTLAFEYLFLGSSFSDNTLIGFFLLMAGIFLISTLRFSVNMALMTLASGSLFAVYYVLVKIVFNFVNFDSGFLYTRLGLVAAALIILAFPNSRAAIFDKKMEKPKTRFKAASIVLINKTVSGIASIMTLKAVQLGSVAIVQAMAGVQFLFLFIFSAMFGRITSSYFGEDVTLRDLIQKGIAVFIIVVGLSFVFA